MTSDEIRSFLDRFVRAWEKQDVPALGACYTADCTVVSPIFHTVKGRAQVERSYTIASDGLLRIREVCAILNIERHTAYKLIECDVLPAIRVNARVVRVPLDAVQRILAPSDRQS